MHIPFLLDTDAYKLAHSSMYPKCKEMVAYLSARKPLNDEDHRIVIYGIKDLIDNLFSRKITQEDVDELKAYTENLMLGQQYPIPLELWQEVVDNGGNLPFAVTSLADGTVVYPGTPILVIKAQGKYATLVTWLETQIMRLWSPITTATKSRYVRTILEKAFDASVDDTARGLLDSRLHDFGSRGTSSAETAMLTGAAHLLSFDGTDTLTAGYHASTRGARVGTSVLASEHSVMTAWPTEEEALKHLIDICPPNTVLSCVADSYDYINFIWNIVPRQVPAIKKKNIFFVARPDSGNPVKCVLEGLDALANCFGFSINSKGYKVINGAGVIQGDGLDVEMIERIISAVHNHGFSIQNVAFGMGGGLLQKQTRDTLSFAMKLCSITYTNGVVKHVMKAPTTDNGKQSFPGKPQVSLSEGIPTVYPEITTWEDFGMFVNMLQPIWNEGPVDSKIARHELNFVELRTKINKQFAKLPPKANIISRQMQDLINRELDKIRQQGG